MQLIKELKFYMMALESIKTYCLNNAIQSIDDRSALIFIGQYVSYAACQSVLSELITKHERLVS